MDVKEIITDVTDKIQKNANVKAVFGDPIEKGNIMVIPVSSVSVYGGGGGGIDTRGEESTPGGARAQGMGLGVKVKTTPVGYIEITNDGARFVEIVQNSKIILRGMALGAFAIFSFTRLLKKLIKKK